MWRARGGSELFLLALVQRARYDGGERLLERSSSSSIVAEKAWLALELLGFGKEWQALLRGDRELATRGPRRQVPRSMEVFAPAHRLLLFLIIRSAGLCCCCSFFVQARLVTE